jgi:hypothetical protein
VTKIAATAVFGGLIMALTGAGSVWAQTAPPPVYPVKFVCGTQVPVPGLTSPSEPPVKPGNYATTINIEGLVNNAQVATTVSVANGNTVGGPGFGLLTNQTMDITCADISKAVGASAKFITGFVNITPGSSALSVTAVYTSQGCDFPAFRSTVQARCEGPTSIEVVPQQFVTPPTSGPAS